MIQRLDLPSEYGRIDIRMGEGSAVLIVVQCEPGKLDMIQSAVMQAIQPLRDVPVPAPCQGCGG